MKYRPIRSVLNFLLALFFLIPVSIIRAENEEESKGGTADIPAGIFYLEETESITLKPDSAVLHLGVSHRHEDYAEGLTEMKNTADRLKKALTLQSVTPVEVRNLHFRIWSDYDYSQTPPAITSYVYRQMYEVTVNDVEKVGAVMDLAVKAGANEQGGISFLSSEEDKAVEAACNEVLKTLDKKAERLAESLGGEEAVGTVRRRDVNYSQRRSGLREVLRPAMNMSMQDDGAALEEKYAGKGGGPVSSGVLELQLGIQASYTYGDRDFKTENTEQYSRINIDGYAETLVAPDHFRVSFTKETHSEESAEAAVAANDAVFSILRNKLADLGVGDEMLQTIEYNVGPYYDYNAQPETIAGWTVSHRMELRIPVSKDIETVMNAILAVNFTNLDSDRYFVANPASILRDLSIEAVTDAYRKYKNFDEREVACVIVSETGVPAYGYYDYYVPDRGRGYDISVNQIPDIQFTKTAYVDFLVK